MSTIGERLKKAREKKEFTQVQVMEHTGINNKTLSGYENDVSTPDPESFKLLSTLYGVTIDYLMGNDSETIKRTSTPTKAYHNIDATGLAEEDIRKVEEYIELLKQKYNPDGTLKKK